MRLFDAASAAVGFIAMLKKFNEESLLKLNIHFL